MEEKGNHYLPHSNRTDYNFCICLFVDWKCSTSDSNSKPIITLSQFFMLNFSSNNNNNNCWQMELRAVVGLLCVQRCSLFTIVFFSSCVTNPKKNSNYSTEEWEMSREKLSARCVWILLLLLLSRERKTRICPCYLLRHACAKCSCSFRNTFNIVRSTPEPCDLIWLRVQCVWVCVSACVIFNCHAMWERGTVRCHAWYSLVRPHSVLCRFSKLVLCLAIHRPINSIQPPIWLSGWTLASA